MWKSRLHGAPPGLPETSQRLQEPPGAFGASRGGLPRIPGPGASNPTRSTFRSTIMVTDVGTRVSVSTSISTSKSFSTSVPTRVYLVVRDWAVFPIFTVCAAARFPRFLHGLSIEVYRIPCVLQLYRVLGVLGPFVLKALVNFSRYSPTSGCSFSFGRLRLRSHLFSPLCTRCSWPWGAGFLWVSRISTVLRPFVSVLLPLWGACFDSVATPTY